MLFNFKNHCPATMSVKSVGGVIVKEHICLRPKGHKGPHQSREGLIWLNPKEIADVKTH